MARKGEIVRKTGETDIRVNFCLDGEGRSKIHTGTGFFDHMLELFACHGLFDLEVAAEGDIHVDYHHTVEDTGIALGQAIFRALGEKKGIVRYATAYTPMDESLSRVALDISGRPYTVFNAEFTAQKVGDFDLELVEEFFRAVAFNAGLTLHIDLIRGRNNHHIAESIFKGFGRALKGASAVDASQDRVLSTKGIL